MKTKQFVAIQKMLLPELPGFAIKGSMMLMCPVKAILRGIYFEGSDFDKTSFYVNVFALPLCVPTKHLYFNFGNRLRLAGADRWNANDPNEIAELGTAIRRDAAPFLLRTESLLAFVEVAKSFSSVNPHTPMAIAFTLARAGRVDEAVIGLDQLLPRLDLKLAWQSEIADQVKTLRTKLVANPSEAQQQLEAWEAESVRNLGLEALR
jgi:hypothetical protein